MALDNLKPEEFHYRGIWYVCNKWKVQIKYKQKILQLGRFFRLKDAIDAYDKKAIEIWGENATTNKKLIKLGKLPPITNQFDFIPPDIRDLDDEIWKDVTNFEGLYKISNLGRVKSLITYNHSYEIILKPKESHNGYWEVCLWKNHIPHFLRVHRLVAFAFIPNPEDKPYINHKNFDKKCNKIDNLEWVTHRENIDHAIKNGKFEPLRFLQTKVSIEDIRTIKKLVHNGVSKKEIVDKYPIKMPSLNSLLRGDTFKDIN